FQNKLKKHDYSSPKEKDKSDKTGIQSNSKEATNSYQETSINNREISIEQQETKALHQYFRNESNSVHTYSLQRPDKEVNLDQDR
ncbi:5259_t:CDS:2, partial [Scutellospora calospora]